MVPIKSIIVQSEKRKHLQNTLYYLLVPPLVFVAAYSYLRIFTPMAPDWWHDGYMLANALAIREGAFPYRDIFQIYGMTTTWIHGIFQPADGHTVLSLRNLSIAFSAMTAVMICLLPTLGFSHWIGASAAVAWVLISDYAWSDDTWWVLPWSPVISTFLLTLIVLVVGHLVRLTNSLRTESRIPSFLRIPAGALIAGLLVTLTTFTRLVPGLLSALAIMLICAATRERRLRLLLVGSFLLSLLVSFGVVFLILAKAEALKDASEQTFGFASASRHVLLTFFQPSPFVVGLFVLLIGACTVLFAINFYLLRLRTIPL